MVLLIPAHVSILVSSCGSCVCVGVDVSCVACSLCALFGLFLLVLLNFNVEDFSFFL